MAPKNTIKAIIFDHDGTLVDSEYIHYGIWKTLLAQYGVEFSEDEYFANHIGVPTYQGAEELIATHNLTVSATDLYDQNLELTMQTLASEPAPLMPGVQACIDWCLTNNITIAIATGASRDEILCSLNGHECLKHCVTYACREDVPNNKPAPDVYELVLQKLNLGKQECVAIEDSHNGTKAAIAAGLPCIAVPNNYSRNQDFSIATHTAANLLDALNILQNW